MTLQASLRELCDKILDVVQLFRTCLPLSVRFFVSAFLVLRSIVKERKSDMGRKREGPGHLKTIRLDARDVSRPNERAIMRKTLTYDSVDHSASRRAYSRGHAPPPVGFCAGKGDPPAPLGPNRKIVRPFDRRDAAARPAPGYRIHCRFAGHCRRAARRGHCVELHLPRLRHALRLIPREMTRGIVRPASVHPLSLSLSSFILSSTPAYSLYLTVGSSFTQWNRIPRLEGEGGSWQPLSRQSSLVLYKFRKVRPTRTPKGLAVAMKKRKVDRCRDRGASINRGCRALPAVYRVIHAPFAVLSYLATITKKGNYNFHRSDV